MTDMIQRNSIGYLEKIGQGGQGVVYKAPSAMTVFGSPMVYKEYKAAALASLNVTALKNMPNFLEALPFRDGEKLISLTAWPCRIVEDNGPIRGFLMPSIPERFFTDFWTSSGQSRIAAEFQHLLNEPQVLAMRFRNNVITERQRYELLSQMASGLAFLHERGICVGDISPKNLLFSLSGAPAVYFIDSDAMRVGGVSLSHQLETPGWEAPGGEEKATTFSDRYKFGLLALRLLVGNQDTRDPARLPASVPQLVRQVITDTLTQPAGKRPPLSTWNVALDKASQSASNQPVAKPISTPTASQTKVKPQPKTAGRVQPPTYIPPPQQPMPQPTQPYSWAPTQIPSAAKPQSAQLAWLLVAAIVVISVIAIKAVSGNSGSGGSASPTSYTPTYTPTYTSTTTYYPPSPTTTTTTAPDTPVAGPPPPLVEGVDSFDTSCDTGYHMKAYTGWASQSGRGSEVTSCFFAQNVLVGYWAFTGNRPDRRRQVFAVDGAKPCGSPSACSGSRYIVECEVLGSDSYITCTAGVGARVYLW